MIVAGYKHKIRQWVAKELGVEKLGGDMFEAVGIIVDDELVGGVVYHEYRNHMIELALATTNKKWCTRPHLKELFLYPFEQLGVTRINATCAKKNKAIRKIMERLGFKQEGCARKAFGGVDDAIIYGMLKKECKWI